MKIKNLIKNKESLVVNLYGWEYYSLYIKIGYVMVIFFIVLRDDFDE